MKDSIVIMNNIKFKILQMWTFIRVYLNKFYRLFIDIDSVVAAGQNLRIRYYLLKIINYFISKLIQLRNCVDQYHDLVKITKNNTNIVLENTTLSNAMEIVERTENSDVMNNVIFFDFGLGNPENDDYVDLKHLFTKYKDTEEQWNHTLRNLFEIENISFDENTKLHFRKINKGEIKEQDIDLTNVLDNHINYFFEI